MQFVEKTEEFREILKNSSSVCAMFTAEWCPDCQVLKAVLPGLEHEFSGRFEFVSIDRDRFTDLAEEYDILGIPSFVTFSSGRVTGTFTSRLRKTRQQIVDFLEDAYSKS